MRRQRNGTTQVWHNPELATQRGLPRSSAAGQVTESASDKRQASQHRAALEALFSPPAEKETRGESSGRVAQTPKPGGRIVLAPPPQADPQAAERQRLLAKLLAAEGRPAISKSANDFVRAGFTFPAEQDVQLQLLEHADEDRVRSAIDALGSLLVAELPKRRTVLDSRLRRIEQFAEDDDTRVAAERLRRTVSGKPAEKAPT